MLDQLDIAFEDERAVASASRPAPATSCDPVVAQRNHPRAAP
jgi:hypothetical protein